MGDILGGLWDLLTPSLGGSALAAAGIGMLAGLIRKVAGRRGAAAALLAVGGIVAVAWAVRSLTAPPGVEVRAVEGPIAADSADGRSRAGNPPAAATPRRESDVRWVQAYEANAMCLFCKAFLNLGGRKGNTAIACAYCGGRQSALQAILRLRAYYEQ